MGGIPVQVWVLVVSFLVSVATGLVLIPMLKRLNAGQTVRDDGPKTHLKKMGTPTFGGLIIILPVILVSVRFMQVYESILYLLLPTVAFGLIGFADDMIKVVKRSKDGLSPKQKMFWLLLVAATFSIYAAYYSTAGTEILLPFTDMKNTITVSPILFIPFTVFVMVATVNAVNLTDGVDGLAGTVTLAVLVFFAVVSITRAEWDFVRIFSISAAGGCLGFLVFNIHPAKVIMGDTGSFALGGALASIAVLLGIPWVLVIAGIVYVLETLSDIIQVAHFKATGKRVFKMAPLHHHFELSGWKENRIVIVFTAATILFCILSFVLLGIPVF